MEKFTIKHRELLYESLDGQLKDKLSNDYKSLKRGLLEIIEDNINGEDLNTAKEFVSNYIKNPAEGKINGLIELHDLFNFYLKFQDDIDSLLKANNFFTKPVENATGLYDIVIIGTKEAILLAMKELQKDVFENFAQV